MMGVSEALFNNVWTLIPPLHLPVAGYNPDAFKMSWNKAMQVESNIYRLFFLLCCRLSGKTDRYCCKSLKYIFSKTCSLRRLLASEMVLRRGCRCKPR